MAFCPNCGYEFRDKTTICPECEDALVNESEMLGNGVDTIDKDWVEICSLPGGPTSERAEAALEANSIPAQLVPAQTEVAGTLVELTDDDEFLEEEVIVLVPAELRDEAAVVLESILGDDYLDD